MPVSRGPQHPESGCFDALKMGFMMGCVVGIGSGAILGAMGGYRAGFRGRELMSQMSKTSLQSAGTFGTFMSVGMGLRSCV